MKIFSKKGFILVETLIVTAFVAALFILVYQNMLPSIGEYEKMSSYDDVDSVYATNVMKKTILRDVNFDAVDTYLNSHSYVNISDCSNKEIYKNQDYCIKVKNALQIKEDDYIFLTHYEISHFRDEVRKDDFFDSGKLSNFRGYVNTVSNLDSFYDPNDSTRKVSGKYRLFLTRTVTNSDLSTTIKYANIGVFLGEYQKYTRGTLVTIDTGDGIFDFYVLKDSSSTEDSVLLLGGENFASNTTFNNIGTIAKPDPVISILKNNTKDWYLTETFDTSDTYTSLNGYTIDYTNSHARLLNENDLYSILGCESSKDCFDVTSLFPVTIDSKNDWLLANLSEKEGYWLASTVNSIDNTYAWGIKDGKIMPVEINNSISMGVRPVIKVKKNMIK